ncbi:MAG: hypothetical protein ABEJ04_05120 [Halobacteriaceae archaeon]
MKRYATKIADGTLYVETEGDWLELGTLEDIYALVGGREYDIEYEKTHAEYVDWVDADSEGVMTIDVRETLEGMTYPAGFVEKLQARSMDVPEGEEYPERTAYFADVMATVWAEKGNLGEEENPFLG